MELLDWMPDAIADEVLSLQEAMYWTQLVRKTPRNKVLVLPQWLQPAAERVYLWQQPVESPYLH